MIKQIKRKEIITELILPLVLIVLFNGCSEIKSPLNSEPNDEVLSDSTISIVQKIPKAEPGDLPSTRGLLSEKQVIENTYSNVLEINPSILIELCFTDSSFTITGDSLNITNFYEKTIAYLDTVDEMSLYTFNDEVIKDSRRGKIWYYKHWKVLASNDSYSGWFTCIRSTKVRFKFTANFLFSHVSSHLFLFYQGVKALGIHEGNDGNRWENPVGGGCKMPGHYINNGEDN